MTLAVYPDSSVLEGLGFSQKWTPEFFNVTATAATGADIDLGLAQYPLHTFELAYNFLRDTEDATAGMLGWPAPQGLEFKTLMGFWLQIGGTLGRFLFKNKDDYRVAAQEIATGDGTTTTFGPIVRGFGAGGFSASEPVGQIDTGSPVVVRLGNAVQPPSAYAINTGTPLDQTISFASAPASGTPIYMDFSYFYYCKFADNASTFEKFANRLWRLQKVTVKSCRPEA